MAYRWGKSARRLGVPLLVLSVVGCGDKLSGERLPDHLGGPARNLGFIAVDCGLPFPVWNDESDQPDGVDPCQLVRRAVEHVRADTTAGAAVRDAQIGSVATYYLARLNEPRSLVLLDLPDLEFNVLVDVPPTGAPSYGSAPKGMKF